MIVEHLKIFFRFFKPKNPQLLKKYIYEAEKKKNISKNQLGAYAKKYQLLGDFYWSKKSISSGLTSGWYYVLSAECFEEIGDLKSAGYLYHYAGNQFRRIGTLEKAMKFYFKSAKTHFEINNPDNKILAMAHRSTRRSIGLSKSSGDEEILKEWMGDKSCFSDYVLQYKDQNIWD